jgi:hypothetical protein
MRASTSPASSFGGRPTRTAAPFAAAGIFIKRLVFIAIDPGSASPMVGGDLKETSIYAYLACL